MPRLMGGKKPFNGLESTFANLFVPLGPCSPPLLMGEGGITVHRTQRHERAERRELNTRIVVPG
jgi:hypothetical protein